MPEHKWLKGTVIWQASHSPASLGQKSCQTIGVWTGTKSSTSNNLSYCTYILPYLFRFVKNVFVPDKSAPFLIIDLHKRNNRIFEFWIIRRSSQSENDFELLLIPLKGFKNQCGGWFIGFDNVVRMFNAFGQKPAIQFIVVRVSFFDV
jgi:hypothetical protein